MDTLISLVGSPVNAVTLIIVFGILVFQLADRGLLRIGKNDTGKEKIPMWAQKLIQYTNHDTTQFHKDTHHKLDKMGDELTEIKFTMKSIKEDGIKCKKE